MVNAYFAERRAKLGKEYKAYLQRYRFSCKLRLIGFLGGERVNYGETNPLVLTLNHIGGLNGPREKEGYPLYLDIIKGMKEISAFDLRCLNCQISCEFDRGTIFSDIASEVKMEIEQRAQ